VKLALIPLVLLLVTAGLMPASAGEADSERPQRPGREVSLPPSQVRDTFFAYVLGIVFEGLEVDIDNAEMREILTEFTSKMDVPFDLITRVIQHNEPETGERTISLVFNGAVVIPIPFSLLGYHPGTIRSTEEVSFRVLRSLYTDPKDPKLSTWVYDLALSDGNVLVDVDDWIVYLLGNIFDKIQVRHIVFFNYDNEWIGLLEGKGKVFGRNMREYFDFTHNGIVFPVPPRLDEIGLDLMKAS
jgi:hypothetical protein